MKFNEDGSWKSGYEPHTRPDGSEWYTVFTPEERNQYYPNQYKENLSYGTLSGRSRQILDTCSYISVMSAQDPGSRDYFVKFFGTMKDLRVTSGDNGKSSSEDRVPILRPETFGNLGRNVVIYMNGKYIVAEKTFWKE